MKVHEKKIGSKKAVVIIPEIYGINQYVKDWADFFNQQGYDAFCIDLSPGKNVFSYSEEPAAYKYFTNRIGFEVYREIEGCLKELRHHYEKLIIFGSSVGATIAWRLTENEYCDGMIGYYGSRIRNYLEVKPNCPCLLVFAEAEKSFDVKTILTELSEKSGVRVEVMPGKHGFCDPYGTNFHIDSCKDTLVMVEYFLKNLKN